MIKTKLFSDDDPGACQTLDIRINRWLHHYPDIIVVDIKLQTIVVNGDDKDNYFTVDTALVIYRRGEN